MKFTDGNWMLRKGVSVFYPAQAYHVEHTEWELIALATKKVNHRGDTLEGPVLTVTLFSPAHNVIGVRIEHYSGAGDPGPNFPLVSSETPIDIAVTDACASLKSGDLEARIDRADSWGIQFLAGGKPVTGSGNRGLGYATTECEGSFLHEQLDLSVGECVYGLGERFSALVKNGQSVDTWNRDGGAGSDQAYKCIPFYLTNRGYGVFVNYTGDVSFEVATEKVSRVQFSVQGESLEYYIIYGPTPKEILARYCALTGMPALPPAWSFGLWLTTSFTTSYDEQTVTGFIQGMADRDLPLQVFHFDCFWMREFHWCDFTWDERVFPDPPAMLARLKQRGLKICVWINPYIAQASSMFEEGKTGGFLLKKLDGSVWQTDQWQPGMAVVDFTNPEACVWYQDKLKQLLDMGVDCFKTDFGERIPTGVQYYSGADAVRMHNFYSYLYNETVYNLLRDTRGEGEAAVFARSATACCQKFPIHWGGDCFSNFGSMAASLRGGLSLGLCGFGFWSHDIGGFEGTPPVEVYKRWIAFGLLSTHSRLHGSSSYRVPWVYDDEAVDVLRLFTKLKCRLMPYLFQRAAIATQTGTPVMRAMMLEFPADPACDVLDRQYMLGDSLLVAPVFTEDGWVDYYLPDGRWTNLITLDTVEGGGWRREQHGFLSLPLMVGPNTLLAIGSRDDVPDYDYTDGVTFELYELDDGATAQAIVPDQHGLPVLKASAKRAGNEITAEISGSGTWRLQLVGIGAVLSISGGSAEPDDRGAVVWPDAGSGSVVIRV